MLQGGAQRLPRLLLVQLMQGAAALDPPAQQAESPQGAVKTGLSPAAAAEAWRDGRTSSSLMVCTDRPPPCGSSLGVPSLAQVRLALSWRCRHHGQQSRQQRQQPVAGHGVVQDALDVQGSQLGGSCGAG